MWYREGFSDVIWLVLTWQEKYNFVLCTEKWSIFYDITYDVFFSFWLIFGEIEQEYLRGYKKLNEYPNEYGIFYGKSIIML